MGHDLLLDPFAHWFPQSSDLIMTGARLDWQELGRVEPSWSLAVEHMRHDIPAVWVEEFGDSGYVEV